MTSEAVHHGGDSVAVARQLGPLGQGPPPAGADIARAVRLGRDATWCIAMLSVGLWLAGRRIVRCVR